MNGYKLRQQRHQGFHGYWVMSLATGRAIGYVYQGVAGWLAFNAPSVDGKLVAEGLKRRRDAISALLEANGGH